MTSAGLILSVKVDAANPGQFFACCGLLELAHRLSCGAEGWFVNREFSICCEDRQELSLSRLLSTFKMCPLFSDARAASSGNPDGDEDSKACPLELGDPFRLRLDWWTQKGLKPWAGSMDARVIFAAMRDAIDEASADPFNHGGIVLDPAPARTETPPSERRRRLNRSQAKKREPFYFDSRRGANAKALDIGFMPDALKMTTIAFPAVESLCLIGLQRFRPMPTDALRVFDYCTWSLPLGAPLASVAVCGRLPGVGAVRYRFENAFRTDQRKHKGFLPATRIGDAP